MRIIVPAGCRLRCCSSRSIALLGAVAYGLLLPLVVVRLTAGRDRPDAAEQRDAEPCTAWRKAAHEAEQQLHRAKQALSLAVSEAMQAQATAERCRRSLDAPPPRRSDARDGADPDAAVAAPSSRAAHCAAVADRLLAYVPPVLGSAPSSPAPAPERPPSPRILLLHYDNRRLFGYHSDVRYMFRVRSRPDTAEPAARTTLAVGRRDGVATHAAPHRRRYRAWTTRASPIC